MRSKSTAAAVHPTAESSPRRCGGQVQSIAPPDAPPAEESRPTIDQTRRMRAMKWLGVCTVAVVLLSGSHWNGFLMQAVLTALGQSFVMLAVIGRLWSMLYIGGRKNDELVTLGPYSVSRNPLYVCSTMGAAGVGLLFGSVLMALLLGGATGYALYRMARNEAAFLRDRFGTVYDEYAMRVPLFWPRPSAYEEAGAPQFLPGALRTAACDGLVFLAAIPAAELVRHLKAAGSLPEIIPVF